MACRVSSDDEESLICRICMEYYDVDVHIPKFLQCHHTLCVVCLQSQVRNSSISCPYCRKETVMSNGVGNLTTNFYILPQVHRLSAKRKEIENIIPTVQDNCSKAIAMHKEGLIKLEKVVDSFKILENIAAQLIQESKTQMTKLESILAELESKELDELKSDLKLTERELNEAKYFSTSLNHVEQFVCHLSLKSNSESYCIKTWEKPLTFDNNSIHGSHIGAAQSVLSFILCGMEQNDLWDREPTLLNNLCFIQFKIGDDMKPPVIIRLDFDEAPEMSRNFQNYCRGINGQKYEGSIVFVTYPGEFFLCGRHYNLMREGSLYLADNSTLVEKKGALRMRHRGWNESGVYVSSEFSIILRDGVRRNRNKNTIFAYVVNGLEVCEEISHLDPADVPITIHSSGIWPPES